MNTNQFKLVLWIIFLLKVYSLFMLLFIHLLYLIWEKTLCFNCFRGTSRLWCWLVLKKLLSVTFFTHITKRLFFCSILI